jgi:predicted Fe-S protein YdhL (DUF1289 family)
VSASVLEWELAMLALSWLAVSETDSRSVLRELLAESKRQKAEGRRRQTQSSQLIVFFA